MKHVEGMRNFVKLYNSELEALSRRRFTTTQFNIILWVIRNSRGWNKDWTTPTGVKRMAKEIDSKSIGSVRLALRVLVEHGVLKRNKDGCWALQEDLRKWEVGGSKSDPLEGGGLSQTPGSKSDPLRGTKSDPQGGLTQTPFSDGLKTTTKDIKTKTARGKASALENGPYVVKTDAQAIICAYKVLLKVKHDDRAWDRNNFSRYIRSAKRLLEAFDGDVSAAIDWMSEFKEKMERADREWTLDTADRLAWDSKGKREAKRREELADIQKRAENAEAEGFEMPAMEDEPFSEAA